MTHMDWYAPDRETRVFTCTCGWSGRLADMSDGEFSWDLVVQECPDCFRSLVIRGRPDYAEVREAARRGDPQAIRDLPGAEVGEAAHQRAKAMELKSTDQLPELDLTGPTKFIWDQEGGNGGGESWTVIRLAGSGTEVWREMAYYGGWDRAVAIGRLLRARYGRSFGGLFRTARSFLYLLGDDYRGVDLREASLDETPWVAEDDGEPPDD